ncbi:MAG TPA: twin-arginine translocase subunit TatC [Pirellulales bacterium]|nr:twin-arginine translocase subunit TatC [Pirellulales bacterium]
MHLKRDDDLFKDTTMTFGEHLDELRKALFKAVAGLFLGTCLGLLVGKHVVALISAPLSSALGRFYQTKALEDFQTWADARRAAGEEVFYTGREVEWMVNQQRLMFEIQYYHPLQFMGELKQAIPDAFEGVNLPTPPAEQTNAPEIDVDPSQAKLGELAGKGRLVPTFFWHAIDEDQRIEPAAMGAAEAFSIWMKASLVVGVILSSPWVFWCIWSFVGAGLYPHEKRYVHVFLPFSLGLFFLGALTAYLFVFEPVLNFLFSFNRWLKLGPDPRISEWLSFVIFLPLGFGISFQLPLVMLFLERIGVFSVRTYIDKWRIAIMVIVILSAVLTPADPYTLFFMAIPLIVLYFGAILLCKYMPRPAAAAELL